MKLRKIGRRKEVAVPLLAVISTAAVVGVGLGTPFAARANALPQSHIQSQNESESGPSQRNSNGIQHVVYIIMDNVHMSDVELMPHLMSFLHQGTLFTNDHTVLDSHTQDGMLSDMTGKYPSQTGVIDQGYYENTKDAGLTYSSFAYWTHADADGQPHVTTTPNWTAFNQHGLSVGAVGAPDMELESTKEVTSSMMNGSDTNASDYLGIAVHNADGTTTFGSPNLPYLYNTASWSDSSKTLGGFPGWSDDADLNWSLQATYEMQTHNVPVTFTYLHDAHEVNGKQAVPGTYDQTLQTYDDAFVKFFNAMTTAGLTLKNTLFVITTDEGDHLMPQGELSTNLTGWLSTNNSLNKTADPKNITVYGDSGALVYLKDNSTLSQTLSSLSAVPGWNYIADPAELQALHMGVKSAPDRNPSFVLFSKPDVYYGYNGSTDWSYNSSYVWNHGTISPDILNIWAGMVGPGVQAGQTSTQWLDHADTLPTIYALLGYSLTDAGFDGIPADTAFSKPEQGIGNEDKWLAAENVYKQLNAPVGEFGMQTLAMSTEAAVNATNDQGSLLDAEITRLTSDRDAAAAALQADILQSMEGRPISDNQLSQDVDRAQAVLAEVAQYGAN